MPRQIKRSFRFERTTKNTARYAEEFDENGVAVGVLYVQKFALGTAVPQVLTITIEVPDVQQGGTRPAEGAVLGSEAPSPTA